MVSMKLRRSGTNPSFLTERNEEFLMETTSMSAMISPTASTDMTSSTDSSAVTSSADISAASSPTAENGLNPSILTAMELPSSGALNSTTVSIMEHRARRDLKVQQHLRRFRQRYLETIEEDCFSDFSDDENKENMTSRDVNSNVIKTIRKKKRKTPKKLRSSNRKACNIPTTQEKLYFGSSGVNQSLSTKKSSGRLYFPSLHDSAVISNEILPKQESSECYPCSVVNESRDDTIQAEVSPTVVWSNDKTFLCDHTALASASLKTDQLTSSTTTTTTTKSSECTSIDVNTLKTLVCNKVNLSEQNEVISSKLNEVIPCKQSDAVNDATCIDIVEKIEKSEIVSSQSERLVPINDEANPTKTVWKNLSRISGSSRSSLREQTSAGNLVPGAFHSTFSYPLHSTLQQTEQSILPLSPITPVSPVYSRRVTQRDLQQISSKFAITKHHMNKYVERDSETNNCDNDGSSRPIRSFKKFERTSGLSLVNNNYVGWYSSERLQSNTEPSSQNYRSLRMSRKLGDMNRINDSPLQYKDWMKSTVSNDYLPSVNTLMHSVNTFERRTNMKRSIGRIGLVALQPTHAYTAQSDPHISIEATRGSHIDCSSFSTDHSSWNGSSFSRLDSSTESSDQGHSYMNGEYRIERRSTHQYLYESSHSTFEQDDVKSDSHKYCMRPCTNHVRTHEHFLGRIISNYPNEDKHRKCCNHRTPSTPLHIHPHCQRYNTLPDLIRLPSQHEVIHDCCQRRISPFTSEPLKTSHHRYQQAGQEHCNGEVISTKLGSVIQHKKRSKTLLGGKKLGCFTRMLCTNSEITQIFTADQFE